ncbi:uncharacterized protein LOC123545147 [Mercenaria mercenaria]|uniref:uncharacterized protein LOC123545147 n=1 Tax=Mercenaria mercenaria TaxID=6596 RepID=UPI00234EE345|nr:uncharacterized protein LOC123545147 [Mercenaria mercenaria]
MKTGISTVVLVFASCCAANGWFFGPSRRSDYPRFPNYVRRSFSSPSGRTTFDVGQYDIDDFYRTWAGLEHREDNWNSSITGTIDNDGNFGFGARFSMEFRKRSAKWNGNHYNITLYVDPCNFFTYDDDRDGVIVKDELRAIFGDNEKTDALFEDLDVTKDDEGINPEEFYAMAPMIIADCLDTEK